MNWKTHNRCVLKHKCSHVPIHNLITLIYSQPGNEENRICFISSTDPLKENLSDIEIEIDAVAEGHDYVELFDMFVEMCIEE